jgi:type II secretory pathway pseudopilin PulG
MRAVGGGRDESGYAMAALLVGMTVLALFMSVALPAWRTAAQRERETELVFRGEQYARAIALYQRKYANVFPPSVDALLDQRFLRKKYLDPMTNGEFQVIPATQAAQAAGAPVPQQGQRGVPVPQTAQTQVGRGQLTGPQGGVAGVASKSTSKGFRLYNGRDKYNEWVFMATAIANRIAAPNGTQNPTGGLNVPGGVGGGRGPVPPNGRGVGPGGRGLGPNQPQGPGNPSPRGRGPGTPPGGGGFGQPSGGQPFGGGFLGGARGR